VIERIGDREGCEVVDASITLVIGSRQPRYQVLSRTELSISHGKGSALPGISFPRGVQLLSWRPEATVPR